MKARSLTRQTILIVLSAQILCALTLSGFAVLAEAHARLRAFDVGLRGRSDSLLGAIRDAEDPDASVLIDPSELKLPGTDVFAVYNQGGAMLGDSSAAPQPLIERSRDGFRTVHVNGIRYRVLQREAMRVIDRAEVSGGRKRPITILYASPETHIWHEIFEAATFSLLAIFLVASLTVLLVGLLLKRTLRPLSELAIAAGEIRAPALRFEPPPSVLLVRELRPLAQVLTESTARLRETFEKERRFVGDAAHELKTAIAVVRSSLQVLMLKRRTPEEYVAGLERVLEDNVRVETLVMQMLELAVVGETPAPEAAPADLGAVAAQAVLELQPIADERGVFVQLTFDPGSTVRLPTARAYTVVSNLLINAIQHSQSGMRVLLSVEKQGEGHVVLKVSDTGTGISKQALPHIFDRFYREDQSRSRTTGGTGLGLSICKAIVDAAGGSIEATSKPNAGTSMTVIFSAA